MYFDIIKNIKILVGAVENILIEYVHLNDEHRKNIPPGIDKSIHELAQVIGWSKNE